MLEKAADIRRHRKPDAADAWRPGLLRAGPHQGKGAAEKDEVPNKHTLTAISEADNP
jgi:hypothetical protein